MHHSHTTRPRMRLAARIALLVHVLCFAAAAMAFAAVLTGCAQLPGVTATDAERAACAEQGCTVWTQGELESLARKFFKGGYAAGAKSI